MQKTIPQFADMRKNANSFAQYQINNLKDGGAILVRLSTRQKTIKMTVTQLTDYFMILLKEVTTVRVKQTFTVWLKYQQILLTNALHRVFLLRVITAEC